MISKKVAEALNSQVAKEAYASNYYLAMASWSQKEGLRGCSGFFYAQADEEREHMMKLVKYINEAGGHALAPQIDAPPAEYKSVAHVFGLALEHELEVTRSINKLVDLSFAAKDFSAFNFLQWYVVEQLEEENLFRGILDIIKLEGGKEPKSLLLIDNEIARIRSEESKA